MRLFVSKLKFIHSRLWDRDGLYRVAVLFGPAPVIGCAVAAAIWFAIRAFPAPIVPLPMWAKLAQSSENWSTTGEPQKVEPESPIPDAGAKGGLSGYESGWRAMIRAVEMSPTLSVDIKPQPLGAFTVEGSTIDLAWIIAAVPQDTKFVGVGSGFLVVRTPGIYALSARFERPPGPSADCLIRFGFGSRRVVATYALGFRGNDSRTFDAAKFDLQPGLYPVFWVLGCWRDQQTIGSGTLTVLIRHPGEQTLHAALPDEIVRPGSPAPLTARPPREHDSRPSGSAPRPPTNDPGTATGTSPVNAASGSANPVGSGIDQVSGLEKAVLGRTFQSTLLVSGFQVPLPPGEWAILAKGTLTGNVHPENKGNIYFLGHIVRKRLVGAIWVQAMHSPGFGFEHNQNCTNPDNLYVLDQSVGVEHQACMWIRSFFSADMQQWADKTAHLDQLARAAGRDLAAKGVTYPQELVTVGFQRAEKWGEITAGYLFSPEKDGISSSIAPSYRDSEWYKANLQRYPEKLAYVTRLQQWAMSFSPKFQVAFDGGKQAGD
jgi:hypothetical protein